MPGICEVFVILQLYAKHWTIILVITEAATIQWGFGGFSVFNGFVSSEAYFRLLWQSTSCSSICALRWIWRTSSSQTSRWTDFGLRSVSQMAQRTWSSTGVLSGNPSPSKLGGSPWNQNDDMTILPIPNSGKEGRRA